MPGSQSDDRDEEEDEAKNSTYDLEYVEQLPKPQIEHKQNDDQCPHEECRMPDFRFIVVVIEDDKGGYHIGDDCRRSCASNHPAKTVIHPTTVSVFQHNWFAWYAPPLKQAPNLGAQSVKCADHCPRFAIFPLTHSTIHGRQFCQRDCNLSHPKADQNATVEH